MSEIFDEFDPCYIPQNNYPTPPEEAACKPNQEEILKARIKAHQQKLFGYFEPNHEDYEPHNRIFKGPWEKDVDFSKGPTAQERKEFVEFMDSEYAKLPQNHIDYSELQSNFHHACLNIQDLSKQLSIDMITATREYEIWVNNLSPEIEDARTEFHKGMAIIINQTLHRKNVLEIDKRSVFEMMELLMERYLVFKFIQHKIESVFVQQSVNTLAQFLVTVSEIEGS